MAEDNSREHDEHQKSHRVDHQSAEHDQAQYGEATQGEQTAYSTSLVGDPRLNSRGNQSVKAAVMRQAQQTQGNRALQRAIQRAAQVPVQREDEKDAEPAAGKGVVGGAVAGAAPAVNAGNPVVAALWNTSVQQPVEEAKDILQGTPSKSKIITADEKVKGAAAAIRNVEAAIPAGPANDLTRSHMQTRNNSLVAMNRAIEPHAGQLEPIPDIHDTLALEDVKLAEVGVQVGNTSPTSSSEEKES